MNGRRTWQDLIDEEGALPPNHLVRSLEPTTPVCVLFDEIYGLDDPFFRAAGRPVWVAMNVTTVHMSRAKALQSDLFGLCLDQPMAAVPLRDTERLWRFRGAVVAGYVSAAESIDSRVHPVARMDWLDPFLHPERQDRELEKAHEQAQIQYVAWASRLSQDVPDEARETLKSHAQALADQRTTEQEMKESVAKLMALPWVQETISKMPKFELVALFRHCPG